MKSAFLTPVFLAVSVFLSTQKITAFAAPTTFDGTWAARISADEYRNPDGTVALGWVIHIPAKIKNGQLYAEYGPRGADGSFVLHGKIAANGKAILHMTGTTGDPGKTVTHPHPGKPYDYEVIAHFDEQHGTGKSIDQIRRGIGRDKFFTFVRDPGPDLYRRVADLLVSQGNVPKASRFCNC